MAAFMLAVMWVLYRKVCKSISRREYVITRALIGSETRLTQRLKAVGGRIQRQEQETAEIKGALNVIQNALPLRIGE